MYKQNEHYAETPPLISVIMPCYNAARFVADSISSALGQTYPSVEVIVIDDGSSDDSRNILRTLQEQYGEKMQLLFQDHKGPFPARNLGLRNAKGKFIAFLDADDYWRENCLQLLYEALIKNDADLAYCGWQNEGQTSRSTAPYIPPKYEDGDLVLQFLRSCPWPIHAALGRRSLIDSVNGFSERRFSAMDYDLWLRMVVHIKKIVLVPKVLAFYRWHGNQISSNTPRQVVDAWHVRKDFVTNNPQAVAHIPGDQLTELTKRYIIREAYHAYWARDLVTAKALFQQALLNRTWSPGDLRYIVPSLLPISMFQSFVNVMDRRHKPAGH